MMRKLEMTSGPFQAALFNVITWNPESKLFVPRESSFLLLLKCIDMARATSTSLDVMLDCQIRVQVSQDSPCWMINHQMDIHGPGGD